MRIENACRPVALCAHECRHLTLIQANISEVQEARFFRNDVQITGHLLHSDLKSRLAWRDKSFILSSLFTSQHLDGHQWKSAIELLSRSKSVRFFYIVMYNLRYVFGYMCTIRGCVNTMFCRVHNVALPPVIAARIHPNSTCTNPLVCVSIRVCRIPARTYCRALNICKRERHVTPNAIRQ